MICGAGRSMRSALGGLTITQMRGKTSPGASRSVRASEAVAPPRRTLKRHAERRSGFGRECTGLVWTTGEDDRYGPFPASASAIATMLDTAFPRQAAGVADARSWAPPGAGPKASIW